VAAAARTPAEARALRMILEDFFMVLLLRLIA
jgi:hypothetical protein